MPYSCELIALACLLFSAHFTAVSSGSTSKLGSTHFTRSKTGHPTQSTVNGPAIATAQNTNLFMECNSNANKKFKNRDAKEATIGCCVVLQISICLHDECSKPENRGLTLCAPLNVNSSVESEYKKHCLDNSLAKLSIKECNALPEKNNRALIIGGICGLVAIIIILVIIVIVSCKKFNKKGKGKYKLDTKIHLDSDAAGVSAVSGVSAISSKSGVSGVSGASAAGGSSAASSNAPSSAVSKANSVFTPASKQKREATTVLSAKKMASLASKEKISGKAKRKTLHPSLSKIREVLIS